MKKILVIMLLVTALIATTVMAYPKGLGTLKIFEHYMKPEINSFRMILVEKASDWSVIEDGAYGLLQGKLGKYLMFDGHGLKSTASYQLIYYGDETHNNVWPYATCLTEIKTSMAGTTGNIVIEWYYGRAVAGGGHKIWLVLSSDVDCTAKQMIAWQPAEYLFEWDTI